MRALSKKRTKVQEDMNVEFPVTESSAVDACRCLEKFASSISISRKTLFCLDHALAEYLQNLYDHSVAKTSKIDFQFSENKITIVVRDDGLPYNVIEHPPVDTTLPLLDRPVGGLGIHLIRQLMDEVHYSSAGGWNSITLIKINSSGGSGSSQSTENKHSFEH